MDSAGSDHWRDSADALGAAMNKYKNKPQEWNGEKFRSIRELKRYQYLLVLQYNGDIRNLRREVPYVLAESVSIKGRKRPPIRYVADYVYEDAQLGWSVIVEDCKGARTAVYNLKRHLMKSVHGIDILET